jgi:hypothetical protein
MHKQYCVSLGSPKSIVRVFGSTWCGKYKLLVRVTVVEGITSKKMRMLGAYQRSAWLLYFATLVV